MIDRVTLRLEGLMLEKLVNLALAGGVCFADIRRDGRRCLRLTTDAPGAKRLSELAATYHIACEIVSSRGPRALLANVIRRATLLAALAICAVCMTLFLDRIWIVDVRFVGDRPVEIDEAALREALRAQGVVPGMHRSRVDTDALELNLAAKAGEYAFVGARVQGVRLLVEASPEVEAPELFELGYARDLFAACDGVVISVSARSGQACVAPGDTVRAGQLLIRGEERVSKEETRGVSALGEVIARTWFEAEAEGSLVERVRRYTGRTSTASALKLLDWQLPLTAGPSISPAESEQHLFPVGGLFLPLAIEQLTLREYEESAVPTDEDALKARLSQEALFLAEEQMRARAEPACQIVDKWIDYSMIDAERLRARAVLEVHQNIATTRDALYQGGN